MGNTQGSTKTDVLLEEYKLLKQEVLVHVELYSRQTQYIQIYGAVLASLLVVVPYLFGNTEPSSDPVPPSAARVLAPVAGRTVVVVLLVLGGAFALFLATAAMSASYMFLVLRRRMAWIENEINKAINNGRPDEPLLYESKSAPLFLENWTYGSGRIAPHVLSAIMRITLLVSIVIILDVLALTWVKGVVGLVYASVLSLVALVVVCQWRLMYSRKSSDAFCSGTRQAGSGEQIPPGHGRLGP